VTVATEFAKSAQRMLYFLCIEGVGWLSNESDISAGLVGDIFWTDAPYVDGGATAHKGLIIGGSVSDALDPVTGGYSTGGLTASLVDYDNWWTESYRPHLEGTTATLNTDLTYKSTTVVLDDAAAIAASTPVWIAGRECVLLGTRSLVSGTTYSYASCTRGYLGTPRGNVARMATGQFIWPADLRVYDWHRFWRDRQVRLYAIAYGESIGNAALLWSGRLRDISENADGVEVKLVCAGDPFLGYTRFWRAHTATCYSNSLLDNSGNAAPNSDAFFHRDPAGISRVFEFVPRYDGWGYIPYDVSDMLTLAASYQYRTEPGGTVGMIAAWEAAGDPQAADVEDDADILMAYVKIGDEDIFLARRRYKNPATGALARATTIECDPFKTFAASAGTASSNGMPEIKTYSEGVQVRFLLDNFSDVADYNRFTVNGAVTRNPVDVLLCFLTTRDDEYFIADAAATSTSTQVKFTAPGFTADMWNGAALFCVEGTAGSNKGQARLISDGDTTSVTVSSAFTAAPTVGTEYQIRNSIYDVLPLGWGLNIPYWRIDIASFETIRDKYLADAQIGKFIIGTQDVLDVWTLVRENICRPYGIMMYVDRTTGKLTATYLGHVDGDGVIETYTSITNDDIIEAGVIDRGVANPIGKAVVVCRDTSEQFVGYDTEKHHTEGGDVRHKRHPAHYVYVPRIQTQPSLFGGKTKAIEVHNPELDVSWADTALDTIEMNAHFNTPDNVGHIATRLQGLLRLYAVPAPTVRLVVDCRHISTLQAGTYCVVTWDDAPINPFTGARGWSQVICRVIGSELLIADGPAIAVTLELLQENLGGRIAPAAKLAGALNDSDATSDWFEVSPRAYVNDQAGDKDYYHFEAGDRIELRDKYGALREGPFVIRSFGDNDSADPQDADTDIIRVTTAISSTPAAGDYVTFATWSNSNTSHMDFYAAYALSTGFTTSGDTAKKYQP
jgi:hypothetical protein